jgi:hypothetical protein
MKERGWVRKELQPGETGPQVWIMGPGTGESSAADQPSPPEPPAEEQKPPAEPEVKPKGYSQMVFEALMALIRVKCPAAERPAASLGLPRRHHQCRREVLGWDHGAETASPLIAPFVTLKLGLGKRSSCANGSASPGNGLPVQPH